MNSSFTRGGNLDLAKVRRILLIQLGDIGDVVLTVPTIRALRENVPNLKLVVCVREKARELIEDLPWADGVIAVDKRSRPLLDEVLYQIKFFTALRRHHFDLAIELRSVDRGAIIALLSGARLRVARYASDNRLWRNRFYTHLVTPPPKKELDEYAAEHNLNIIAPLGLQPKHRLPVLQVPATRDRLAVDLLRQQGVRPEGPTVAVHPFSLWSYKEWRIEEWAALIDHLNHRFKITMIVTGSVDERPRAERLVEMCQTPAYNLAGLTSLGVLAAVLRRCAFCIGVDTGAMHIAAAVGTPTLSIFGPSPAVMWASRGDTHTVITKNMDCVPCRDMGCQDSRISNCLNSLLFDHFQASLDAQMTEALRRGRS